MTVSFGTLLPCPARDGKLARTEDDQMEESELEEQRVAKQKELLRRKSKDRWLKEPGAG